MPKTKSTLMTNSQSDRFRKNIASSVAGIPLGVGARSKADMNPDGKLTELQRQFVMNVAHYKMNQTAAARGVGASNPGTAAHLWMKMPKVQRAIAVEREEYAKASQITRKQVVDGFLEGISMGKIMSDPTAVIRGWREVGLMCGYYAPTVKKITVSHSGEVLLTKMQAMSDSELLALAENNGSREALTGEYRDVSDPLGLLDDE